MTGKNKFLSFFTQKIEEKNKEKTHVLRNKLRLTHLLRMFFFFDANNEMPDLPQPIKNNRQSDHMII